MILVSIILTIKKNREIREALYLIEKSETLIRNMVEKTLKVKDLYLQNIFLRNLTIRGTFRGLNNSEVSPSEAILPGQTVSIFISDSACLDCMREYISLLFKYFYKEAVIIRLGPLTDNQEFLEYKIWGLTGFSKLEEIIKPKMPLIAFVNKNNILEYTFIPVDSDLDLFERYLKELQNILRYQLQLKSN